MKNKKDFCHSIFTETKALTSFCGTTQFGAKHPLIPYTDIYAPLLTGGDPVGYYSAQDAFLPTLISPFDIAVITAITAPADL